jgi:ABC-type antimicrobial peptide transport system permease subunit
MPESRRRGRRTETAVVALSLALGIGANGLTLAAIGLAVGLALSIAATPLLRTQFIGVSPWDSTTFVVICGTLCAATLIARWVPANRATRVDPVVALRHE